MIVRTVYFDLIQQKGRVLKLPVCFVKSFMCRIQSYLTPCSLVPQNGCALDLSCVAASRHAGLLPGGTLDQPLSGLNCGCGVGKAKAGQEVQGWHRDLRINVSLGRDCSRVTREKVSFIFL